MRRFARLGLAALACAALLPAAAALAATQVARSIAILPTAGATSAVQNECGLQTAVPQAVAQAAADVTLVDAPAKSGRWLELSISEVTRRAAASSPARSGCPSPASCMTAAR